MPAGPGTPEAPLRWNDKDGAWKYSPAEAGSVQGSFQGDSATDGGLQKPVPDGMPNLPSVVNLDEVHRAVPWNHRILVQLWPSV